MDKFYNHKNIEKRWQKMWEDKKVFSAKDPSTSSGQACKEKFYALCMFPYPSAQGLHVGHPESYTAADIVARKKRMEGYNVLNPMGWDAFGLPAENFAIKQGVPPWETTLKSIDTFRRQIKSFGFSYDWDREVNTSSPEYYKWTQWMFLKMYEHDLAYKQKAKVNWCESCQTVLANEQVIDGKCERCKNQVVQKDLEQWFFRVTKYAQELLDDLENLDWPEPIKLAQKNWIGKSEGASLNFNIKNTDYNLEVFTTRPDTLCGATYMVVAPEHDIIEKLKSDISNWDEVEIYVKKAQGKSDLARQEGKDKTGVELKGVKAINPVNDEEIPIYVADYVLAGYGTGAIMAVPAHDERDFEFAKKFGIEIREVVVKKIGEKKNEAIRRDGVFGVIINKGKMLLLHDRTVNLYRLPGGGFEEKEIEKEALAREIIEETGYLNFKIEESLGTIQSNYYAVDKKEERHRYAKGYNVILTNEARQALSIEDKDKYEIEWLDFGDALNKLESNEINFGEVEFVKRYINPNERCYSNYGILINSGEFDGMTSEEAKVAITKKVGGELKTQFKLRDWLVSRQRYWGAPIPIVYCEKCGMQPVPEKDLPVKLPQDVDFRPTGESPLARSKEFHNVKCLKCSGTVRRESDTMDTFVCSSWYFLRFTDPHNTEEPFSKDKMNKYMPVDFYTGGAEHAVLHLMYSRFFVKALRDMGYLKFSEPFLQLRNQGMILGEDSQKMSKSRGNVVNPDEVVEEYGADTMRLYEMFMGPYEDAKPWSTKGIIGVRRFLEKVWLVVAEWLENGRPEDESEEMDRQFHKTIKKVTEDINNFKFNTAISAMMILVNQMAKEKKFKADNLKKLLIILSCFAPHIAEEIWSELSEKDLICRQSWPLWDDKKTKDETIEIGVQVNGKLRATLSIPADLPEEDVTAKALEQENVKKYIKGKEVIKKIYVPGRLVSIVIK